MYLKFLIIRMRCRMDFETLAEAYVKIKNGEDVLEKAKEYVDRYIERWKR